jgi:fucose 4-O-acetylase-like acetyltransferase
MKGISLRHEGDLGRYPELERIKGLAIVLVVWGHLASATFFTFPMWFLVSISVVYSFHMPLFMYVSGFVFFHSRYHERFWKSPTQYIIGRVDRLIIPFVLIGLIITCGKFALGSLGGIPDPVESLAVGIWEIVANSPGNPAASVWYLIVLFSYTVITPILIRICRNKIAYILAFSATFWIFEATDFLYIDRILHYYIFFILGGLVARNYESVKLHLHNWTAASCVIFFMSCWFFHRGQYAILICGLCSIPAIHGLFSSRIFDKERILLALGGQTMIIYLTNTIIIGILNILFYRIFDKSSHVVLLTFFMFFCATCIPILLKKTLDRFHFFAPFHKYIS